MKSLEFTCRVLPDGPSWHGSAGAAQWQQIRLRTCVKVTGQLREHCHTLGIPWRIPVSQFHVTYCHCTKRTSTPSCRWDGMGRGASWDTQERELHPEHQGKEKQVGAEEALFSECASLFVVLYIKPHEQKQRFIQCENNSRQIHTLPPLHSERKQKIPLNLGQ